MKLKPLDPLMNPPNVEPPIESIRQQVLQRYRRKRLFYGLGVVFIFLIGGIWWYLVYPSDLQPVQLKVEPPLSETAILESAGVSKPDTIEEIEETASAEPPSDFKIQITDDRHLYREAEEAFLSKNWPEAIQAYQKLINLYPQNLSLWFNLALVYHYHGNLEQARHWYRKVLLHNPDMDYARKNLNIINHYKEACLPGKGGE